MVNRMTKISIGRFDNLCEFEIEESPQQLRLWSKNPNQLCLQEFTPIASDGLTVFYNDNTYSPRDFSILVKQAKLTNLIVLTDKEKMLLVESGAKFAFELFVLEENFPIFNNIKFNADLNSNIRFLSKCLSKVRQLGVRGYSLGQHTVTEGLYKTERKIRWKNSLDTNFFFASFGGYQEIFKAKEERKDRIIVALDYNSMYASCMLGEFLEPKSLSYKRFDRKFTSESIPAGFYRVKLIKPKTDFIKTYHPIKYTRLNRSYSFKLKCEDEITLFLFHNELEYYQQHFEKIIIIDGIVSPKTIEHPLVAYVTKLYNKRLKAKREKNSTLESFLKLKLAMLHSSTNKTKEKTTTFDNYSDLVIFLENEFCLIRPEDCSKRDFIKTINDSEFFSITYSDEKIKLKHRSYRNAEQLFSLSAKILANARLKMTRTLEYLLNFDEIEVCYVNIDSIHVSIPRTSKEDFIKYSSSIISDKLGDLKVQCFADKGYWLDVGRYWLINNDQVKKFANVGFNSFGNSHPFISQRKKLVRYKTYAFDFWKAYYINIENSFSFNKRLLSDEVYSQNYERFDFHEVSSLSQMCKSEQKEVSNSLWRKASIFNQLKSIITL
ncbi:hypothetical protein GLP31_16040 [Photobacterium carnosum]|nr:hypothetical protein [Photobacterium carnosum]